MTISAAKIRQVCTSSEAALVRASRHPNIDSLSHAELKRLAVRARKLADKWQGLGRSQSRARGRKIGVGEVDANTQLKTEIFRDAQANFEALLAKLGGPVTGVGKSTPRKTKAKRSAGHRADRAAVRKGVKAAKMLMNEDARAKKTKKALTVAKRKTTAAAPNPVAEKGPATRSPVPSVQTLAVSESPPARRPAKGSPIQADKQLQAVAAAKKSRVARSGKTTRVKAHISARGRRSQARRDSKG